MPEIIWKRGAEADLLMVHANLEDVRSGLGDRFALQLDAVLDDLRNQRAIAPNYGPPMQRLVIGNTGYGVFHTMENRRIIIHALVHLSHNPASIRVKMRRLLGWP
ncbi:MAG: hypothetical protein QOE70_3961 [Chthoniobacter sp.]|jgi:hypothetical protein|nr:hypothetical protein [Chthoniobacter sp.]